MKAFRFFPVAALAAGTACAPGVDVAAEQDALRQADAAYSAAIVAKDVDAWAAFYAGDAVMYPPNSPTIAGTDAIRAFGTEALSSPGFSASLTPVTVHVSASGGMGYTFNTGRITVDGPDGSPVSEELRDFHVWRKEADGSWKLVVDIWNSPTAPSPPAPAAPAGRR